MRCSRYLGPGQHSDEADGREHGQYRHAGLQIHRLRPDQNRKQRPHPDHRQRSAARERRPVPSPLSTTIVQGGNVDVVSSSGQDITTAVTGGSLGGILASARPRSPASLLSARLTRLRHRLRCEHAEPGRPRRQRQPRRRHLHPPGHLRQALPQPSPSPPPDPAHLPPRPPPRAPAATPMPRPSTPSPTPPWSTVKPLPPFTPRFSRSLAAPSRGFGRKHDAASIAHATHNAAKFGVQRIAGPGSRQPYPIRALLRRRRESLHYRRSTDGLSSKPRRRNHRDLIALAQIHAAQNHESRESRCEWIHTM